MKNIREIISSSPAPLLTDANAAHAELLVFALHEGVDWQVWGGARRARYWDALADRVRAGTYAGPSLSDWWESSCYHLSSTPRDAEHRRMVAELLFDMEVNQKQVLKRLREDASVLVLRVRVHIESSRESQGGSNG